MPKDTLEIPLTEVQSLSEIMDLPVVGTQFGLSFATYKVVQTYKLEVKFKLKCMDKTFSGELDSQRFIVLSPLTKEVVEKTGSPALILQDIEQNNKGGGIMMNTDEHCFQASWHSCTNGHARMICQEDLLR